MLNLFSISNLLIFLNFLIKISNQNQLILKDSFNSNLNSNFDQSICPKNPKISCKILNSTLNSCCTNHPGGQLLLTQFWDTNPSTGPNNSWTIHGLWPDNCDGTYQAVCDQNRSYNNITQILKKFNQLENLNFMNTFWKDQHGHDQAFWSHEWSKHGTCISTLEPNCFGSSYSPQSEVVTFFNSTINLFKTLPTFDWLAAHGIIPSFNTTYSLAQLQNVANYHFGKDAVWNCRGHLLNEVWWHHNTIGTIAQGSFIPASPIGPQSTCPNNGIKYLPKYGHPGDNGGHHHPKHPNHPHDPHPNQKYFIHILNPAGNRQGCLISNGNWYTHGTCASFSITKRSDNSILEINSRKGPCDFINSTFKCAKNQHSHRFSLNQSHLTHDHQDVFFATAVPDGRTQVHIIKSKAKYPIQLEITPAY